MKARFILIGFMLLMMVVGFQNKPQQKDKFEYLVVFLSAERSRLVDNPKDTTSIYWPCEFRQTEERESVGQEKFLDFFGKDGWHLVNIVGMIGGDKLYYFERKK
jgi:hypothetical protein